jgi:hypothetical protein
MTDNTPWESYKQHSGTILSTPHLISCSWQNICQNTPLTLQTTDFRHLPQEIHNTKHQRDSWCTKAGYILWHRPFKPNKSYQSIVVDMCFLAIRKSCYLKDPPSLMCLICVFDNKKKLLPERPAFADVFVNVFLAIRKNVTWKTRLRWCTDRWSSTASSLSVSCTMTKSTRLEGSLQKKLYAILWVIVAIILKF